MKRINPFSVNYEEIKKKRLDKMLRRIYEHNYSAQCEMYLEEFENCWWSYCVSTDFIKYYVTPHEVWDRYNNQLGLEIFDIDADMEYLENLPADYKDQNSIIEEYNKFIRYSSYHDNNYWHFYLCKFKDD